MDQTVTIRAAYAVRSRSARSATDASGSRVILNAPGSALFSAALSPAAARGWPAIAAADHAERDSLLQEQANSGINRT